MRSFSPVTTFDWQVNRSERTRQVRLLVPLLDCAPGRIWFFDRLGISVPTEEIAEAQVFHFCFPLRDIFTMDYYACRGNHDLEDQFIAYYSELFCLPLLPSVWRATPDGPIRHPAAGGRAGWYESYLEERIGCEALRCRARDMRRILDTEAGQSHTRIAAPRST